MVSLLPRFASRILFIALFLLPGILSAQIALPDAYNTDLYGSLDPNPPANPQERYSALWGYTDPDGREYALLGGYEGTHIIDITEQPIKEVAFIPGLHSAWRELKTWEHYAYVVNETGGGLQIIDLSNLPNSASLVKSDSSVFRTGHTIAQEGTFLYVNGSNVEAGANQGTLIFDLADDPTTPKLVGKYDERYMHDVVIRNDTMYGAAINDGQLDIVYLGPDRTNPQFVTDIRYFGAGTHNADLTTDGSYVMTTDEVGLTDKTLKVWDLRDRENIAKVADWTPVPNSIVHNVRIVGNLAYISWYTGGTRIADISDPTNPVEIAHFDAYPSGFQTFNGNWDIYPYFKSGKLIASYMESGLYVFTTTTTKKGTVNGRVRDAISGEIIPNAVIHLPILNRIIQADDQGNYELAAGEGLVAYNTTAFNYVASSGEFSLTEAGARQDILMNPLPIRNVRLVPVDKSTNQPISDFSYSLLPRFDKVAQGTDPIPLSLPTDSSYVVMVGKWGYLPVQVPIPSGTEGDIMIPLEKGYADNAEVNLNWSYGNPTDEAVTGRWARYVPAPGSYIELQDGTRILLAPDENRTGGAGKQAFATRQPGFNVDSGTTTLTSPLFNLTEYIDPRLSIDLWYNNDGFFWLTTDDRMHLQISNDGGENWTELTTISQTTPGWKTYNYKLNEILPATDRMLFRAVAADSNEDSWVFVALDEFSIVDQGINGVNEPIPHDEFLPSTLQLSPNPSTGNALLNVQLSSKQSAVWIDLLDGLGRHIRTIYQGAMNEGTTRLPLHGEALIPGFYIVRFVADDGSVKYIPANVVR